VAIAMVNMLSIKNMTLKTRMLAAFAFMGLIVLIVALIGWSGNGRLSHHLDVISNDAFPSTVALWEITEGQIQIQASERLLLNPTLNAQFRQREIDRINAAWSQINRGFRQYEQKTTGKNYGRSHPVI
jgi:methyl-accepting chemotaxis protein WspA